MATLPEKPTLQPPGAGGYPNEGVRGLEANAESDPTGGNGGAETPAFRCITFDPVKERYIPFPSPSNPFFPFFDIRVGGYDLVRGRSNRPSYITYFDFEHLAGGYAECNVRLFSPDWDVVSTDVIEPNAASPKSKNEALNPGTECTVSFGYSNGVTYKFNGNKPQEELFWSPTYQMFLMDYQPKFVGFGVEIDIKLVCNAMAIASNQQEYRVFRTQVATNDMEDGKRGVFEEICKVHNWIPCAPATEPILEYTTGTDNQYGYEQSIICQNGVDDVSFINNQLCDLAIVEGTRDPETQEPTAMSSTFFYESDSNTAHLHSPPYKNTPTRQYIYARQRFGTVLSFRPHVEGMALAAFAGYTSYFSGMDDQTGKLTQAEIDPKKYQKLYNNGTNELPPDVQNNPTTTLKRLFPSIEGSLGNLVVEGAGFLARAKMFANTAELVVLGDPWIKVQRNVMVIVLDYQHKPDSTIVPRPHFTSGIWTVQAVRHIIQNGEYITILSLFRSDYLSPEGFQGSDPTSLTQGTQQGDGTANKNADLTQSSLVNSYETNMLTR